MLRERPSHHDAREVHLSGARVAVALRDGGRATIAQLAERTGLSRPTVEAALPALRERGLVEMTEEHTAGGRGAGRPARVFEFVADAGLLVGVDVGIHRLRVTVADLTGRIVAWHQRDIERCFAGAGRLGNVVDAVRTCFSQAGIDIDRLGSLSAMAVAVSGMVGRDGRLTVSHNVPEWEGVDIGGRLQDEFGCPVAIENDMRLAALAEHRMGAARLMDDVACFFAGHRISLSLIIGGRLRRGRHGAAGEIGGSVFSIPVDDSGQLRWEAGETAEDVFRAAASGDAAARAEIDAFVCAIAPGIATVTMAVDPDVVVVGGGLSRAGDDLLRPLRAAVLAEIGVPVHPLIVQSELGAEAVVLGALALASAQTMERLYLAPDLPEPHIDVAGLRARVAHETLEEVGR